MFSRNSYVTTFTDMLTLRDLAESTVKNYTSYLNQYLDFIDSSLGGKPPEKRAVPKKDPVFWLKYR